MKKVRAILTLISLTLLSACGGEEGTAHPPGTLIDDFGTAGVVTTDVVAGFNETANAVAFQTDGKIVVAGTVMSGSFAVVRYHADGTPDTSFGTGGIVTTAIGSDSSGLDIAIQPDGKIVASGYANTAGNADFALVRYDSDGSLDVTFGTGGIVTTPIGSGTDEAISIALQSDGKIVLAGDSNNGTNYDIAVARYNSNGALDNSFGAGGKVTTAIGSSTEVAYDVAVQPNGKIVVAGYSKNGSQDLFAVLRYDTNGALDASFGSNGIVTTDVGGTQDEAYSIALQSDNKIVVAGYSYNNIRLYYDFAVVRYNSNGSLDTTFDTDGKSFITIGSKNDFPYAMVIQSNGKIVVGGDSDNGATRDFALARLNSDGSLDTTFDSDGKLTTDIDVHDSIRALAIGPGGKIAAAGQSGASPVFTLVEYWL